MKKGTLLALLLLSAPVQADILAKDLPEPFLGLTIHTVLADCTYRFPKPILREMCWQHEFRENAKFREELKDAGWRLIQLYFAGGLGKQVSGRE